MGFSCGDEYHQSFVAGRSPAVKDVCIDSFGVFWGIILVRIIGWTGRKHDLPSPEEKEEGRCL
ncbi:MAG: VanZ family protein [Lachnospiraceae bacterium]